MKQRGLVYLMVFSGMFLVDARASAQPVQLFLDATAEPVIGRPVDIDVLVLNENGEVIRDYEGKRALKVTVEEGGRRDESYKVRAGGVRFKKGKGVFSIEDSEGETLDVTVRLDEPAVSGRIGLTFLDKDIYPPEVEDIFEEDPGVLRLVFTEEVEEESAQDERNYTAVTNKREVHPVSIEYHRTYVFLKFEEVFLTDEEGYIELEGVKDLGGNEIESGYRTPDFEGTCTDTCPD